jgi:replicative DNA helicase
VPEPVSVRVPPVENSDPGLNCRESVSTATDHAKTLLAAIIPQRADLLDRALRDLSPDQIPDRLLANLFTLLERYYGVTSEVLTRAALADLLVGSKTDQGTIAAYQEIFDELHERQASEADFRWAVEQIRELSADRQTGEAITEGMAILTRGVDSGAGGLLRGHADARMHVLSRFAEVDRQVSMRDAPEGDMRGEGKDILAEYAAQEQARLEGRGRGIDFGVPPLDERVGGLHRGELILIVGYTSDGKTSMAVQLAWSAVVQQAKNVLFLTTETIRHQVRRKLIARHSCLPAFAGQGDGLNSRAIKEATLNAEEKIRFAAAVDDFDANPDYGSCYIAQIPRAATMQYIESKILRVSRNRQLDLVIMDYLALLHPVRKRNTVREELSETLKSAKQLSTTVSDGLGVPFVSPWQVSRSARIEAETKNCYTLAALSETAETSNSADTIISLLAPLDNESRKCKVKGQLMKHRDGEKANSFEMQVDYATSKFSGPFQQGTSLDAVFDPIGALV